MTFRLIDIIGSIKNFPLTFSNAYGYGHFTTS